MLDRTFENNGVKLRLTYNENLRIYKGHFLNVNHSEIFGDTVNEVLEIFNEIVNNSTVPVCVEGECKGYYFFHNTKED